MWACLQHMASQTHAHTQMHSHTIRTHIQQLSGRAVAQHGAAKHLAADVSLTDVQGILRRGSGHCCTLLFSLPFTAPVSNTLFLCHSFHLCLWFEPWGCAISGVVQRKYLLIKPQCPLQHSYVNVLRSVWHHISKHYFFCLKQNNLKPHKVSSSFPCMAVTTLRVAGNFKFTSQASLCIIH